MSNPAKRINWSSRSGSDPQITFSSDDWMALENSYGRTIEIADRPKLASISNGYLWRVGAERRAARESDVIRIADDVHRALADFIRFASNDMRSVIGDDVDSDAFTEFGNRFDDALSETECGILLQPGELMKPVIDDGPLRFENGDPEQRLLKLSNRILTEFSGRVHLALNRVKGGYLATSGFEQGQALRHFLVSVKEWAKDAKYPVAAYTHAGETPAPLSELIFQLHSLFPAELQEPKMESASAVAARLKRASTRRSK